MLVSTSTEFRTFDYKTTLKMMKDAGFTAIEVFADRRLEDPEADEQRIYLKARKGRIK